MHLDVLDLRNFYYRTKLGRVVQKAVRDKLVALWPAEQMHGQTMAGYGFAVPLLRPYLDSARRVIALMPAEQGVMPWPAGMPNVSVLCEQVQWPLETGMVDRLVLLHGLETAEHPSAVLEESWRVLGPGGRAIIVVPNRAGLWARREDTPFAHGRPFSLGQLETLVRRAGFMPERHCAALYMPPSSLRFWLRSAQMIERMGQRVPGVWASGAVMLEVSKQVHAPLRGGLKARVRAPLRVLEGASRPTVEPI